MQTSSNDIFAEGEKSLQNALHEVESVVRRCEKMKGKFPPGSSQDSLLKNRLHAMYVAKTMLDIHLQGEHACPFTRGELERALPPVDSIIRKCTVAQKKWEQGTRYYQQFQKTIDTMQIVKELIYAALQAAK